MILKLGKKAARPEAVKLKLGNYINFAELPRVAEIIGNAATWPANWRVLANDKYGDCFWAGSAHEVMVLKAEAGDMVPLFTDRVVLQDYSDCTGFKASVPSSDAGTDMQTAAAYRQKTGIIDCSGLRHTIDIYTALKVGDVDQLALATALFGAVGVGVDFPSTAMDQFHQAEPWSVVSGAKSEGGHYVPCIGRNSQGNFLCVTWGRLQAFTPAWFIKYNDEGLCYVSLERLNAQKLSPNGFDQAALMADFNALQA